MKKILTALLVFFAATANAKDVELSWENGTAFIPDAIFARSPKNISLTGKYPVLIYLHGCMGITRDHDILWAMELAKHGFVVIMPDSYARPGRIPDCDPNTKTRTGAFPMAYAYRQQEITYALEQVRRSDWADQQNIFLMGHSEGGVSAARSKHGAWNAQVISAWTCTIEGRADMSGIHSPAHIPVMAVAYLNDGWRRPGVNKGRCIDQAPNRKVEQIDLEGSEHYTYYNSHARESVIRFLKSHLRH